MLEEPTIDPSPAALAAHAHRWQIGEQHGPESAGACACGASRIFHNGWQEQPGWLATAPRAPRRAAPARH
ncbi:MAG: hypothetical protein HYX53_00620 [Chloroflexi bacterium]|nr:hypothetical protein [Chloroflexota bacterium]